MLGFLRRIRRSLIEEGRLRKYLIYAIGEILLVMIGILLALQVNNWNIERVNRIEEAEILEGIEREFKGYRQALERSMLRDKQQRSAMAAVLYSIEQGRWASDEMNIDEALWYTIVAPTSDFGHGVRDAVAQSGRLELITDRVLREKLSVWPSYFEELYDDELLGRNMVMDTLIPYLTSNGYPVSKVLDFSMQSWPVGARSIAEDSAAVSRLLSDSQFHSLLEARYGLWAFTGGEYQNAIEAVDDILQHIERVKRK